MQRPLARSAADTSSPSTPVARRAEGRTGHRVEPARRGIAGPVLSPPRRGPRPQHDPQPLLGRRRSTQQPRARPAHLTNAQVNRDIPQAAPTDPHGPRSRVSIRRLNGSSRGATPHAEKKHRKARQPHKEPRRHVQSVNKASLAAPAGATEAAIHSIPACAGRFHRRINARPHLRGESSARTRTPFPNSGHALLCSLGQRHFGDSVAMTACTERLR